MKNPAYNYPEMKYWYDEAWEGRTSCVLPLMSFLSDKDAPACRAQQKESRWSGRSDGIYDPKTLSCSWQELRNEWTAKGMELFLKEMGGFLWMALVPGKIIGNYGNRCNILVIPCTVDYDDRCWAMDTVDRFANVAAEAAKNGDTVVFATSNINIPRVTIDGPLHETFALWHITDGNVWMMTDGIDTLKNVPGFTLLDPAGNEVPDPDSCLLKADGVTVLPIDGLWTGSVSALRGNYVGTQGNSVYSSDMLIHSIAGRRIAKILKMEHQHRTLDDHDFQQRLIDMGLTLGIHRYQGEQWLAVRPSAVEEKLPAVMIVQEVPASDMHSALSALLIYRRWLELAAEGECMLLFFALESTEDNYMFVDILDEAEKLYAIDDTRVYITGHSHNGYYTADIMRHAPQRFAAIATLGNTAGLPDPVWYGPTFSVSDKTIAEMAQWDMPTVNICGLNEHIDIFPLYDYASRLLPENHTALDTPERRMLSWQRRLQASRCPVRTTEELLATKNSGDKVERLLGIPCDRSEVQIRDGIECYIADIRNCDGKFHLRQIAFENMPHVITPLMCDYGWEFMRRFARDPETKAVIELY